MNKVVRLTRDRSFKQHLQWSPDGKKLLCTRIHRGKMGLWTIDATTGALKALLPQASADRGIVQLLAAASIVGIIYGALVSLMQKDWKKLIAYSSVSHLGFCTLGIFAVTPNGLAGSVHVAVADGGHRGEREIERVGLRPQVDELVRAADRGEVVGEGEERDAADERDEQVDQ